MTEIKRFKASYVDLPEGISSSTRKLLSKAMERMRGGQMEIAIGDDDRYAAVVFLNGHSEPRLVKVMFDIFRDDQNNFGVDVEKITLAEEGRQGLATFGIYQAALATLPVLARMHGESSVRMILDDANFGYSWKKLQELFPPERLPLSLDLGDSQIEQLSYHQFNFKRFRFFQ